MKATTYAATLSLVFCLGPTDALAKKKKKKQKAACDTAATVASAVWKVAGPAAKKAMSAAGPAGMTAAQIASGIEKGIKLWNKIAGESNVKIGPRRFDFNTSVKGEVVATRVMISGTPAFGPVSVDIFKRGGKGTTQVAVCKYNEAGRPKKVKVFTIDKDTKNGKVQTVNLPDAEGHVISVVFKQKKAGRSLKWKIRSTVKGAKKK